MYFNYIMLTKSVNHFLTQFVESKGWSFGGGINEIQDGYYILPDGSKGKSVLEDE